MNVKADAKGHRSEIRDGMIVDWDVPNAMDDGLMLRADVYRPVAGIHRSILVARDSRHLRVRRMGGPPAVVQRSGKRFVYAGESGGSLSDMKNEFTECGPFLHDDPHFRRNDATAYSVRRGKRHNLPIIPRTG